MEKENPIPALPAEPQMPADRFGAALLRAVFPPRCAFCGKRGESTVCSACERELRTLTPPPGEPTARLHSSWIPCALSVWRYEGTVRHALLLLKRYASRWRGTEFARQLAATAAAAQLPPPDVIIPVPNYKEKGLQGLKRQPEENPVPLLLAERLAQQFSVPLDENQLIKYYPTPQQHRLSRARRRGNPVGAYRVLAPKRLQDKTVWLVDDIVTTGATMNECARLLWLYGAKQVVGLSFCVTVSRPAACEQDGKVQPEEDTGQTPHTL